MNIDDRLAKLAERHEALAQSLEILTHDVEQLKDTTHAQGDNITCLSAIMEGILDVSSTHERNIPRLVGLAATHEGSIQSLLELARSHENRLFRLEGGQPQGS